MKHRHPLAASDKRPAEPNDRAVVVTSAPETVDALELRELTGIKLRPLIPPERT